MDGAQAVALVRAGGFIAAIESIHSERPEGTVVEQEPPAGTPIGREAVVTLRLSAAPLVGQETAIDDASVAGRAPQLPGPDDTQEWFQTLARGAGDSPPSGASGARRRKRRRCRPSSHELVFDRLPPRSASAPHARRPWFQPSLSRLPLRRASALLAALVLPALVCIGASVSSDRRVQPDQRALRRVVRAQPTASKSGGDSGVRAHRAARSARRPGSVHSLEPRAPRRAHPSNVSQTPAIRRAGSPQAPTSQTAPTTPSGGGQFAYLG